MCWLCSSLLVSIVTIFEVLYRYHEVKTRITCLMLWGKIDENEKLVVSFPDSPSPEHKHTGRAWYPFSHDFHIIRKGPEFSEQKGNVLNVVQPSIHMSNAWYLPPNNYTDTCSNEVILEVIFTTFVVLSVWVHPHAIDWGGSHEKRCTYPMAGKFGGN